MISWMTHYAYCHAGGRPGNEPHGCVVAELDLDRRGCRSGVGDMDEGVERYVRTGRIVGGVPCVCVCVCTPPDQCKTMPMRWSYSDALHL